MDDEVLYDEDRDENFHENEGMQNLQEPREPNELKPCPFCGNREISYEYTSEIAIGFEIWCNVCGATFNHVFDTEIEAIIAWNLRI